jgi:hypothetical protein
MEINIFNILAAVFFCLGGIGLLFLGYRETTGSRNKRKLYAVGCMLFAISVFTVSRIITNHLMKDILTGISVVSLTVISGYVFSHVITERRGSR